MITLHADSTDQRVSTTFLYVTNFTLDIDEGADEYEIEVYTKRTLLNSESIVDQIMGPAILYSIKLDNVPDKYVKEAKRLIMRALKNRGVVTDNYIHSEEE